MKIVFWSPVPGQGHVTSSLLALATYFATAKRCKVNVISTNYGNHGIQTPFVGYQKDEVLMHSASHFGMDALFRAAKGDRLTKEAIEDAAISLSEKLSIFPMATSASRSVLMNTLAETYEKIVQSMSIHCDYVFIDTQGGASAINQKILASADVIVVCLNQNRATINSYFEQFDFKSKRVFILLTDYDRDQAVSMKNIRKRYKTLSSANSAVIPHCSGFSDALNEGKLFPWMVVNKGCTQKDVNYPFIKEIELASKKIAQLCNNKKGGKRV